VLTPAALARALDRRRAIGFPNADTTCYRLINAEADDCPGLTVDVYDDWLVASLYTEQRQEDWLDALAQLGFRGVYLKHRPKQANELAEADRRERCPAQAVRGESAPESLLVREAGVPFHAQLGDGLSTGIFLDQRDNRVRVREQATDKRVLNLFAYTCAFGVAAAVGGARSSTNIDVSKPVLERGKRNYELAGIDLAQQHTFLARDVLDTLPRLARRGERFDLVVLDPPSYASTKRGRFSVERDYPQLAEAALSVLEPGGQLLACLNHHGLSTRDLESALQSAAARAGRAVQKLELMTPPADHPQLAGRSSDLKSAWVTV
jgi:23S rRNA (cytosine1962-C5)-methyltransferase